MITLLDNVTLEQSNIFFVTLRHTKKLKMKIEEAINQKNFRNEWQRATINLLYTHNWVEHQVKRILKPYGVTGQQFNVLRILRGQFPEPITTSVIRERMLDTMSDVSRIVDRLCKKGLVERKVCPMDKRLVDVRITEKGLELLLHIDSKSEKLDIANNNLTKDEAILLSNLLDKMRGDE
jgi:DNA-binding MarR family transcriptional regulator